MPREDFDDYEGADYLIGHSHKDINGEKELYH